MAGLMLLAGLSCWLRVQSGSVFAARAADRCAKLPCAGSRPFFFPCFRSERQYILRQLFAERFLVSWPEEYAAWPGAVVDLARVSTCGLSPAAQQCARECGCERPMPGHCCLPWSAAFLFGLVPVSQVLLMRADPWQIIRSCSSAAGRWRALPCGTRCWRCRSPSRVLITASLVAVPAGAFPPEAIMVSNPGAMLVKTDLHMGVMDGDERA